MEEINKAYATFQERDRIASLGGGVEKIEKQHESGKMTARERIEMLLDKGTFVELDKLMVHRCTNYGMDKNKIPGDGIVSGYGKIDGRQVFVYAYDFTVYGGSLSASNAKKIVKVPLSSPHRLHLYGDRKESHVCDRSGCGKDCDSRRGKQRRTGRCHDTQQ